MGFLRATGRRPGEKYPPDTAGAGKHFTTKTHCAKFVEDNPAFDAAGIGRIKGGYVMARVTKYKETNTVIDSEGNKTEETSEKTWTIEGTGEPDFIKLYTEAWAPKKITKDKDDSPAGKKAVPAQRKNAAAGRDTAQWKLPAAYRFLFIVLAARMGYCENKDLKHSQLVMTGEPYRDEIMEIMGWTDRDSLQKGLRALCECNAIRKVSRGCYQINPRFASKGQWKYNPRITQSNVEGLKTYYNDMQREAAEEKEKKEKEKKKNAREKEKRSRSIQKTGEGKGMPVADTADNPPAGKGAAALPPETSDDTEYDGRYDDGASTKDSVNFINKTQERSIV